MENITTIPVVTDQLSVSVAGDQDDIHQKTAYKLDWFIVIHTSALTSLGISILFSAYTLYLTLGQGQEWRVWKRRAAERFVVYLAIIDTLYR